MANPKNQSDEITDKISQFSTIFDDLGVIIIENMFYPAR